MHTIGEDVSRKASFGDIVSVQSLTVVGNSVGRKVGKAVGAEVFSAMGISPTLPVCQ